MWVEVRVVLKWINAGESLYCGREIIRSIQLWLGLRREELQGKISLFLEIMECCEMIDYSDEASGGNSNKVLRTGGKCVFAIK
jgi:hypothetical protein